MKVRSLKRRVRRMVFDSWREAPRPVVLNEAAEGSGGHFMIRWVRKAPEEKPPVYMVSGHGWGWSSRWVRPQIRQQWAHERRPKRLPRPPLPPLLVV